MSSQAKLGFSSLMLVKPASAVQLLDLNNFSRQYGLSLTEKDAEAIMKARNLSLQRLGRVELSTRPVAMLITAFSSSPHVNQAEYADLICEMIEVFYYLKNESLDEIPDDELIAVMKECFDGPCQGSLDLMAGRDLELLASEVRCGVRIMNRVEIEEV